MTCRDLGQFSIPYNTKDILNSYSSAQKAARRRDIALAMSARDIDRAGNNQLNRLLAYRKERSIAPEFQEAQIERLAGDNYREKEFQRKQEEAMDWQNNFLYNTALFSQGMLDRPSRWEQEDVGELQQRVGGEYLLGESFFKPGSEAGTRESSRPPGSRGQSAGPADRPDFGGASAPSLQSQVSQAFGSTNPNVSATYTSLQNPSLSQAGVSVGAINQMVFNFLPPQQTEAVRVKPAKAGKVRGGTLNTLSAEGSEAVAVVEEPSVKIPIARITELQGLLESGKISADQMQFLLEEEIKYSLTKTKTKGGKARPVAASQAAVFSGDIDIGAGALGGLDEAAIEAMLRSGGGSAISAEGEAAGGDPKSSIDPLVVSSAPESVMSFDDKVQRMLELFDYPNEIQGQYGPELIPDDLRLDFGPWLVRNPRNPRRGDTAWKKFLKERQGQTTVSASDISGGGVGVGMGGLKLN